MTEHQHEKKTELSALLIGNNTVPKDCQVLNVSQQGMSLQCEPDGRLLTFKNGDAVEIYLTAHHDNGHNKFTIPAVISHVDESTVDLVFHCTDTELAELIESYRVSGTHTLEASLDHRQKQSHQPPAEPLDPYSAPQQPAPIKPGGYKLLVFGLPSLLLASIVFMGTYIFSSSITDRLNALESATNIHTNDLAEMQTQLSGTPGQQGQYDSLNMRITALTDAFRTFEDKLTLALLNEPLAMSPAGSEGVSKPDVMNDNTAIDTLDNETGFKGATRPEQLPAAIKAPVDPGTAKTREPVMPALAAPGNNVITDEIPSDTSTVNEPVVTENGTVPEFVAAGYNREPLDITVDEPAIQIVAPAEKVEPVTGDEEGPWVINLLSSPVKSYVDKSTARALSKGIAAVQTSAVVNGKEYWRMQITGFSTWAEAQSFVEPVKKTLAIKDVWIFKRTR